MEKLNIQYQVVKAERAAKHRKHRSTIKEELRKTALRKDYKRIEWKIRGKSENQTAIRGDGMTGMTQRRRL